MSIRPARITSPSLPLSRFIGRERERRDIVALLSEGRLVTLTGPGGVGKTRLAGEVASRAQATFPDGVYFVDLSPLRAPRLVPAAIVRALRLTEAPERPLEETLLTALEDRRALLVLDNFEHLLDAAPFVRRMLERCPAVRALATSREPLRLQGEREYRVPPLPVRSGDGPGEAMALFADRARAIEPDFRLTEENMESVAVVCRRLDGLPLAIELAAARMRVLTPRGLLDRLGGGLGSLDTPVRGVPERQQTLRRTIAWSYDLLPPAEQRLFRRLAVFAGGWTLEAAEAVSEAVGVGGGAALERLESLVAKSLVQRGVVGGEPRFTLLETVRAYALEELAAAGDERAARGAHAAHFVSLAEEGELGLRGAEQLAWLARLEREHDNLRVALEWLAGRAVAGEAAAAQAALRMAGALWRFWNMRGHHAEGKAWLRRALDLPGAEAPTAARALALYGAGFMHASQALQEEGVALQRRRADRAGLAYALFGLGMALSWGDRTESDLARAEGVLAESLALHREAGDRFGEAWAVAYLGQVAWRRRRYGEARARFQESLVLRREIGDLHGVASDLCALGAVNLGAGEAASAERQLEEGVQLWRMLGVRTGVVASNIARLARLARQRGNGATAAALYRESARLWRDLGDARRASEAEAEAERSAALVPGATEPTSTGVAASPAARAWASPAARRAGLTPREWEVLALLVAGGSTASVASALGISPHTVVRHVSGVLDRLGVSTRRAAVARALGTDTDVAARAEPG